MNRLYRWYSVEAYIKNESAISLRKFVCYEAPVRRCKLRISIFIYYCDSFTSSQLLRCHLESNSCRLRPINLWSCGKWTGCKHVRLCYTSLTSVCRLFHAMSGNSLVLCICRNRQYLVSSRFMSSPCNLTMK